MKEYILIDDFNISISTPDDMMVHIISEDGANIIYEAYSKLYGTEKSLEKVIFRVSDIRHLKSQGMIQDNWNYTNYIIRTIYK